MSDSHGSVAVVIGVTCISRLVIVYVYAADSEYIIRVKFAYMQSTYSCADSIGLSIVKAHEFGRLLPSRNAGQDIYQAIAISELRRF